MNYCMDCGTKLTLKDCPPDGLMPYCPHCEKFFFPRFNSAISTVILNCEQDKTLLIQQYGRPQYILVAGYINKGENANTALCREVKEEVDLNVIRYQYNENQYFEKSETLIHNFISIVQGDEVHLTSEVDSAAWFSLEDGWKTIRPHSLAKYFYGLAMHKCGHTDMMLQYEENRIYCLDGYDNLCLELCMPLVEGIPTFTHTFVDPSLRGLGLANTLMEKAYERFKQEGIKGKATCSYALRWFEKHPEKQDILF